MKPFRRHHSSSSFCFAGLIAGMLAVCGWSQAALAGGGLLDPSFGTNGVFSGSAGTGEAAVIDSSGRLIIVGSAADPHNPYTDVALIRLLPGGTLDTSFGSGGIVRTDFGQVSIGQAIAIDGNGQIVVAGTVGTNGINNNFAVARFNSDGTLDTSFNTSGTITTDFGHNNDSATAVAIDATNRIVVAGFAYNGTNFDFALACYNNSGLDASFNATGKVLTDFGGRNDQANAITIDANHLIVVAGSSSDSNNISAFALARYNSDGSPDTTFGSGGEVMTTFSGNGDSANGVAIDGTGKIVAAGVSAGVNTGNDFALARYNSDGTLDTNFNGSGRVTNDFGNSETAHSVAIDANGLPVVAGASIVTNTGATSFMVARYNSDGSLDTNFGTGGAVTTSFSNGHVTATSVAMDSLQRIVVAGVDTGGTFIAARYLSASADLSINKTGSASSVPATQPLNYTITVTNGGPDATLAQVTDTIPAGLSYSSASTLQGTCTFTDPTVTCMLDSIPNQGTATVTINTVATGDVPSLTNTATVAGNDPNLLNNSSSAMASVTPAADVSVTKSGPPSVAPASNIVYQIVVTNNGPSTADGIVLTDPLNDKFVDAITSRGSCSFVKAKRSGTLTCSIGTLTIGTSATVSVTVVAPHKKGTTSNSASVTATQFDPNANNNSSTATVLVQ